MDVRDGGLLKGNPDAERLVVQGGIPIRFVLVPGSLGARPCRLEDRVFAQGLSIRAKQLTGDGQGIDAEQPFLQLGGIFAGTQNLGQSGRLPLSVRAGEVKLVAGLTPGPRCKQAVVDLAQPCDLLLRRDGVEHEVALAMVESDLVLCEDNRGSDGVHLDSSLFSRR